jgi:hypothetical protein
VLQGQRLGIPVATSRAPPRGLPTSRTAGPPATDLLADPRGRQLRHPDPDSRHPLWPGWRPPDAVRPVHRGHQRPDPGAAQGRADAAGGRRFSRRAVPGRHSGSRLGLRPPRHSRQDRLPRDDVVAIRSWLPEAAVGASQKAEGPDAHGPPAVRPRVRLWGTFRLSVHGGARSPRRQPSHNCPRNTTTGGRHAFGRPKGDRDRRLERYR